MQSAVYRAFFIFDLSAMRVIISELKCHEGYPLFVEFGPPYVALCDCHNGVMVNLRVNQYPRLLLISLLDLKSFKNPYWQDAICNDVCKIGHSSRYYSNRQEPRLLQLYNIIIIVVVVHMNKAC